MSAVVIELDEMRSVIDQVRHKLYPDATPDLKDPEVALLGAIEELLQAYFGLVDLDDPDGEDILQACQETFEALMRAKLWQRIALHRITRLKLLTKRGALVLYMKGEPHGHQ